MKQFVVVAMAMVSLAGFSYRFICNGMLANGTERTDECGICDEARAARWENPVIEVVVDESRLPKSISKSTWNTIVKNSLEAWEQVSGSSLRFVRRNEYNPRHFGANEDLHEIFWITDRQEWRKLIGSGEFGTLGATLPRYVCNENDDTRTIFDADLVLNGLPHINWDLNCHSDDCISPQTTLVHELGHFFGLDHPCLMCSSSIMSARAGFDLTYPVFDDMQGLRALYPDNSSGEFGSPCLSDQECHQNICLNDGVNRYCSYGCTTNNDCQMGAVCREQNGQKLCAFVDDQAAGGREEGDSCLNKPCNEPMVCAGASEYNYFCFMPCDVKNDCKSHQDCVRLDAELSLCVVVKKLSENCDHRELCDDNLFCVFDTLSSGFCRAPCAYTNKSDTGCPPSEVCQRMAEGVEICVPQGHGLDLDDNQDGFGQEKGRGGKSREGQEKNKNNSVFGCSTTNNDGLNGLMGTFLCLLWLVRKKVILPFI